MGAAVAVAAMSARIYRGSSSHKCAHRVIIMITRNPSWRSGDPLVKPYPTPPHPSPTPIDPHARLEWGSYLDPHPTPRQSEA